MTDKIVHLDADLKALINMGVDPKHLSVRDGRGSTKYYYIKQGVLTEYLNEAFGCLGWDLKVGEPKIERAEETRNSRGTTKTVNSIEVIIKVTLRIKARTIESSDTVFEHYGIGTGEAQVGQSAKDALGMAIKGAESDGFKRCAAHLGKRFGLLLTQQGTQSLIDYAQANNEGRRREMNRKEQDEERRSDRGRRDDQPPRSRQDDDNRSRGDQTRDNRDNNRSNDRDDNRSNNRNSVDERPRNNDSRNNDRNSERSNARNNQDTGDRNGSKDSSSNEERNSSAGNDRSEAKKQDRSNDKAEAKQDARSENNAGGNKPSKEEGQKTNAKNADKQAPEVSDQYDLEILPMTRPEQASFAKTLLRVVGEAKADKREELVRQHYDVVKDLESKVKKHFVNILQKEHEIDFNAIRR